MTILFGRRAALTGAASLAAWPVAAQAGYPRARSNLGLLLLVQGRVDDALRWARTGAAAMPMFAPAQRALGRVALEI